LKITIELPDALLAAAKSIAAQRRTTLKAMLEHALRREIGFGQTPAVDAVFETNQFGFPVLKKHGRPGVTSKQVYQMLDEAGI